MSRSTISRRTVLRGAGVTMALPLLQSLPCFAEATAVTYPKRFGVLFMGNGINEAHWDAQGCGADMKLSKTLAPLEPLKHKINVIHGLYQKRSVGLGIHPAQTGGLLSGAVIHKGAIIHAGVTVDQMIANRVGDDTPQSSIVLACEQPMTGYHETNFSMAYSSHVSWQSPDSPVPNEVYPSLAWDSLFENRGSLRNVSILDRVRAEAATLSQEISSDDKVKLDEYLTSVREVEKRVDGMRKNKDRAQDLAKQQNRPVFSMDRPANGLPEDLREHARLMCDIIAIGFQTDKTRVASLLARARPVGDVLSVPRGEGWTSLGIARQSFGRLRADRAFPLEPTRLSRDEAGQHARGRWHGAGQFLPDVSLEHVYRPEA